jgi:hypothetical protein
MRIQNTSIVISVHNDFGFLSVFHLRFICGFFDCGDGDQAALAKASGWEKSFCHVVHMMPRSKMLFHQKLGSFIGEVGFPIRKSLFQVIEDRWILERDIAAFANVVGQVE